jgi:hypothetical protein
MTAEYERESYPEPPELLKMVAEAKDRAAALFSVMRGLSHLPLDREALVERGELVFRSLRAGKEYGDFEGLEDLSE